MTDVATASDAGHAPAFVLSGGGNLGALQVGMMYALDAATGNVLWSYASGASVYSGAAVVNGVVYWGSGYPSSRLGLGTSGAPAQLYAFELGQ